MSKFMKNYFSKQNIRPTSTAIAVGLAAGIGLGILMSDGPDMSEYELDVPHLDMPVIEMPELDVATIEIPDLAPSENEEEGGVSLEDLEEATFKEKFGLNVSIDVPTVETPLDEEMYNWVNVQSKISKMFEDKRMSSLDENTNPFNKNIQSWIDMYEQYKDAEPVAYVEIEKQPFKMISEARPAKSINDFATLADNLQFYKKEGYDSVLVTFMANDTADAVKNTMKFIKDNTGLDVWLAFTGEDSLDSSKIGDINALKEILLECAPYADGYLTSWRGTSCHLWKQDKEFMSFVNHTLREANPSINIVDELYFGTTFRSEENKVFETNSFENASAIAVFNFGYALYNIENIMKSFIEPIIGTKPFVGVVVGNKPGYLSNAVFDYKEEMSYKHLAEDKYNNAAAVGTITMHDDGLNKNSSNNLCKRHFDSAR